MCYWKKDETFLTTFDKLDHFNTNNFCSSNIEWILPDRYYQTGFTRSIYNSLNFVKSFCGLALKNFVLQFLHFWTARRQFSKLDLLSTLFPQNKLWQHQSKHLIAHRLGSCMDMGDDIFIILLIWLLCIHSFCALV